ncbi:hypothetical protein DFQ26_001518, partial [Actinomortierella ambigua]
IPGEPRNSDGSTYEDSPPPQQAGPRSFYKPDADTTFADGIPLRNFTVRKARCFMDATALRGRQRKFDKGEDSLASVYYRLR